MRTRKKRWRDAAYKYIKANGPATSERLMSDLRTYKGLPWTNCGPKNNSGASQLLRVDPRFIGSTVRYRKKGPDDVVYMSYEVIEWRLADEESQTDTE